MKKEKWIEEYEKLVEMLSLKQKIQLFKYQEEYHKYRSNIVDGKVMGDIRKLIKKIGEKK